jgi:Lipocalin-like domain
MPIMKHTKFLLFAFFLLVIACKKDDPETSDVAGTWNLTEASCNDGKTVSTGGGVSLTSTFTSTGKNFAMTVTFNEDGTYTSAGSYTAVLKITSGGQTIEQEAAVNEFVGNGTWKIDGNTLTVKDSNGTETSAEILENAAQKFRYKTNVNITDSSLPGYTVSTTGTYFFTLTR